MVGNKKGIYHSTLTKLGEVTLTVKSDVLKSKDKDSYYVFVEHEGSDQYYSIENDKCGEVFKGRKGQTINITATGSRDDARIVVGGESQGSSQQTSSTPSQTTGITPDDAIHQAKNVAYQTSQAYGIALESATARKVAFETEKKLEMSPGQFQAMTSIIFGGVKDAGLVSKLPKLPDPNDDEWVD